MTALQGSAEINRYLLDLEKYFAHISVSDRTELLSIASKKIQTEFELAGATPGTLFSILGSPEHYASKLLQEKGLPSPPPLKKTWKKLFVGFFLVCFLFFGLFLWWAQSFFPLFNMNEKDQKIEFLGGRIQMDTSGGKMSFGKSLFQFNWNPDHFRMDLQIEDTQTLSAVETEDLRAIQVEAENASLGFSLIESPQINYQCQLEKKDLSRSQWVEKKDRILRFAPPAQVKKFECRLGVPKDIKIEVKLKNGTVTFEKPQQEVSLTLENGSIYFYRRPQTAYAFQVQVKNGPIQGLDKKIPQGSKPKKIYPIKLFVNEGNVQID